jgi:hypothetical protein
MNTAWIASLGKSDKPATDRVGGDVGHGLETALLQIATEVPEFHAVETNTPLAEALSLLGNQEGCYLLLMRQCRIQSTLLVGIRCLDARSLPSTLHVVGRPKAYLHIVLQSG